MQRSLLGLVAVLVLGFLVLALPTAPRATPAPFALRASAVNFVLNYSDPASDVFKLWTSNNTHVTDAAGFWILSPSPGTVNLIRLSSANAGTAVDVYVKVQTTITSSANTSYEARLYTRADNATHFIVTYRNGVTNMVTNHTGSPTWDLTTNTTVGALGWLGFSVSKAYLGNITAWNIDATAKQVQGTYTYEDYGWSQPGNPGSAPAFIQGHVTDASTHDGLAGVNVSTGAGGYFTKTNATGYYSLPAAPGTFSLTFSLSGYDSATKTVTVNYQQTQIVDASLSKAAGVLSSPWLWLAIVAVVVVVAVAAVIMLRRRKPAAPK